MGVLRRLPPGPRHRRPVGVPAERQAVTLPEAVSLDLGASLGIPALTARWAVFSDGPVTGRTEHLVAGGAGAAATSPSSWPVTLAPG
jgi:NADPH:quinone reductase